MAGLIDGRLPCCNREETEGLPGLAQSSLREAATTAVRAPPRQLYERAQVPEKSRKYAFALTGFLTNEIVKNLASGGLQHRKSTRPC
jgi:hypothetical protein